MEPRNESAVNLNQFLNLNFNYKHDTYTDDITGVRN